MAAKYNAIKAALEQYEELPLSVRGEVATEYAALETVIASYNTAAEAANAELDSALEIALKALAGTLASVTALAAVWAAIKHSL